MIRTFHSVGQGAFYSEVFEKTDYIILYDCGSANNLQLIEMEIQASFDKNCTIDAVFISHFHADHVNGLEFLLRQYNIKHLFLPELHEEEKMELLIYNSIEFSPSVFIENLIEDPVRTVSEISQNTSIHFVSAHNEESQNNDLQKEFGISINDLKANQNILSGTILCGPPLEWVFIPFNFQNTKRSRKLIIELKKRGLTIQSVDDFQRFWKSQKSVIIDAYKNVPGNMNTNSMVVYSGPESAPNNSHCNYMSIPFYHFWNFYAYDFTFYPGCMYFGDYEAKGSHKWKDFIRHYKNYWQLIGMVQIPHHGSKYNYNREINMNKPLLSVISCGERNKYRHPHAATLREILLDGGFPVIVTERSSSKLLCKIWGI